MSKINRVPNNAWHTPTAQKYHKIPPTVIAPRNKNAPKFDKMVFL
jgi:hypothetical protein